MHVVNTAVQTTYLDVLKQQTGQDRLLYSRNASATQELVGEPLLYNYKRSAEFIYNCCKNTILSRFFLEVRKYLHSYSKGWCCMIFLIFFFLIHSLLFRIFYNVYTSPHQVPKRVTLSCSRALMTGRHEKNTWKSKKQKRRKTRKRRKTCLSWHQQKLWNC
jgi:hypothetical protein